MMRLASIQLSNPSIIKDVKTKLEIAGKLNKVLKISKEHISETHEIIITISSTFKEDEEQELRALLSEIKQNDFKISYYEFTQSANEDIVDEPIYQFLSSVISSDSNPSKSTLLSKAPKKYTIYPPMLLINNHNTFDSPEWTEYFSTIDSTKFFDELLKVCFSSFNLTHIALNKPIIEQDILRRPFNIIPLYGDFGPEPNDQMYDYPTEKNFKEAFWCGVVQNGIKQVWAPRYTMFSRGNIKEKARILKSFKNVKDKCIIDMYAGIGYFTLSYLKLGAKYLICFELNPWSIRGLMSGCEANKIKYKVFKKGQDVKVEEGVRCYIFEESNEHVLERLQELEDHGISLDIAHFNLGLLPSSRQSWAKTTKSFSQFSKEKTCDIHVHENVAVADLPEFMNVTKSDLEDLGEGDISVQELHLEKIKTFAPDVWHICADFKVMKKVLI